MFVHCLRLKSEIREMVVVAYSMLIVGNPISELGYLEESYVHRNLEGEGSW